MPHNDATTPTRELSKEEYQAEVSKVGEATIGRQMVNHLIKCQSCREETERIQRKVIAHIRDTEG